MESVKYPTYLTISAGSLVGGLLSRPAKNYPSLFSESGFFGRFPYLLPNLVCGFLLLIGLITSILFIKENRFKYKELSSEEESKSSSNSIEMQDLGSSSSSQDFKSSQPLGLFETLKRKLFKRKYSSLNDLEQSSDRGSEPLSPLPVDSFSLENDEEDKSTPSLSIQKPVQKKYSPFKDRWVLVTTGMYALLGFIHTIFDEVFPLWCMADVSKGGLGFQTFEIGITNGAGGLSVVMMQLFIFHRIAKRLKMKNTFRLGALLTVPIFFLIPFVNYATPLGKGTFLHFF